MASANTKYSPLRILTVIVNADEAADITDLLDQLSSPIQYQFHACGTATSEILDILGLGAMEKMVAICIVPISVVDQLMKGVSRGRSFHLPGKGVVFTIPVSGIARSALAGIHKDDRRWTMDQRQNEVSGMEINIGHHLIIIAVNQGFSGAVADTARRAGATGGTIWAARKTGLVESMLQLNNPMQGEQEIIAILVANEHKLSIMTAINEKFGADSEAAGIVLSLPVDSVAGMVPESSK